MTATTPEPPADEPEIVPDAEPVVTPDVEPDEFADDEEAEPPLPGQHAYTQTSPGQVVPAAASPANAAPSSPAAKTEPVQATRVVPA